MAATAIAEFIRKGVWEQWDKHKGHAFLWDLWWNLTDMAKCLPPGHPWHTALVEAVHILCARDGRPYVRRLFQRRRRQVERSRVAVPCHVGLLRWYVVGPFPRVIGLVLLKKG